MKKKRLVHVHQRIVFDTVYIRHESSPRKAILLLMFGYVPTVPETEKATVLREACFHTYEVTKYLEMTESLPLLLLLDRFQEELHIVIWLSNGLKDNKKSGVFISIVQEHSLQISLGSVYEKTPIWGIVWEAKEREQARDICPAKQSVFHVEEWGEVLVQCPETHDHYFCRDQVPLPKHRYQELWQMLRYKLLNIQTLSSEETDLTDEGIRSLYPGCMDREIIWVGSRSHSWEKFGIFNCFF